MSAPRYEASGGKETGDVVSGGEPISRGERSAFLGASLDPHDGIFRQTHPPLDMKAAVINQRRSAVRHAVIEGTEVCRYGEIPFGTSPLGFDELAHHV